MPLETRKSLCNRDCPDACGLVATVDGNRIVSLKGDPDHPVTAGFLCYRTSRFPDQLRAEHRLTTALVRRDGELVPVELDAALRLVADRLLSIRAESGPEAIFHYRSGGSLGLLKLVVDRFFERFGPCTTKIGDICSGAGEAAQELDFGVSDSNDVFDLRRSDHIILWGKNPYVSSVHLVPMLKTARAAGARVTLIDPIAHKTRALVDRYVQPRPGGDLELSLGIARALLDRGDIDAASGERSEDLDRYLELVASSTVAEYAERAGVDAAVVTELAAEFAGGPTAIIVGWGLQRRRRGAQTVRSLDALSFVSGNLFRPGGGCSFNYNRRGPFDVRSISTGAAARHVREPCFGEDVLAADPPIRAIWVTAGNPVSMLPDSPRVAAAFDGTEFVVVVDPFLTDTARRADVVLPVPTLLEDTDIVGSYGHHFVGESRPLVDPPAGIVHEVELIRRLAELTGLAEDFTDSVDDYKRRLLSRIAGGGASLERLRDGPVRDPLSRDQVFGDGRVKTPSGKVRLLTEIEPPFAGPAGYPLWLFSNSTEKAQASQWVRVPERATVTVHPDNGDGFAEGDVVTVESATGAIEAELRFDAEQRRDVAIVPKGGHFDRGQSPNVLIEARPTDHGLGAAYLDTKVRLSRR